MNTEALEFTLLRPDAFDPEYKTPGSCGFDIQVLDQTEIHPGQVAYLKTGLRVKVPEGYALFIALRSSTPKKFGLISPGGFGLVDTDYCGPTDEVAVIVQNVTDHDVVVNHGDRIAQGILVKVGKAQFRPTPISEIKDPSRGGFGSTDNKAAVKPQDTLGVPRYPKLFWLSGQARTIGRLPKYWLTLAQAKLDLLKARLTKGQK